MTNDTGNDTSVPKQLRYLLDPTLAAEHKTLLLQDDLEKERERRKAPEAEKLAKEAARLERLKFWHNTPLIVTLVGVITIAANFGSTYFLSNQNGSLEAEQRKREFAYKIMETELGKIDPEETTQRANTLLFLVKVGVLDGLKVAELEAIATAKNAASDPNTPTIPPTIGLPSSSSCDVAPTAPTTGATATGQAALKVALAELAAGVSEDKTPERISEYWTAVDGDFGKGAPWSATFVSWIIQQAGNPDGIALSASNISLYQGARRLGLILPRGTPPLPGDLALYVRDANDRDAVFNCARYTTGYSGIVETVSGQNVTIIGGNADNAVKRTIRTMTDSRLLGYARLGLKVL